jgi:hypothetical protein
MTERNHFTMAASFSSQEAHAQRPYEVYRSAVVAQEVLKMHESESAQGTNQNDLIPASARFGIVLRFAEVLTLL